MSKASHGDHLYDIFIRLPEIRDMILEYLTASETAMIYQTIGYNISFNNAIRLVNPVRDPIGYEDWMADTAKDGYNIMLIGSDLTELRARINNPTRFWNENRGSEILYIWMIVVKLSGNQVYNTRAEQMSTKVVLRALPDLSMRIGESIGLWSIDTMIDRSRIRVVTYHTNVEERNPIHIDLSSFNDSFYYETYGYSPSSIFAPLVSNFNSNFRNVPYLNVRLNPYQLEIESRPVDHRRLNYINNAYICLHFDYINDDSGIDQEEIYIDLKLQQ